MVPWILLDRADIPGGGVLTLHRRGEEFAIRVGNVELMNSRMHGSEEALATVAFERLGGRGAPRVLIGGLGMGFTLAAVLAAAPRDGVAVVAELVPAVVQWNRQFLGHLAGRPLADPRVVVREGDVGKVIAERRGEYDAILLDVDNGPDGLTTPENERLYGPAGLRAAHDALRPKGILGIWSSFASPRFTKQLRDARFVVEEVRARARGAAGGGRHMIWVATKQS